MVLRSLVPIALALAVGALGACGTSQPSPGPNKPGARPLAVVCGDRKSVSISLFDSASGELLRDDCINSGNAQPAPSLSLGGDVILPSNPQGDGVVVAIDRTNGALTWVDPITCVPKQQLSVAQSFYSNPQDLVAISPTKAYVTRAGRNETPTASPDDFDEGDDVLVIDPSAPAVTGRIALGGEAVPTSEGTATLARAGRGILLGTKVYVSIGSSTVDWKKAGHGRVVVIDTETDAIVGHIDLPDFKNCRELTSDPDKTVLVVGCAGVYSDGAARINNSAFVALDVSQTPPVVKNTWRASTFGGRGVAFERNAAMIDAASGVAVAPGEYKATPTDGLWLFDAASSAKLAESATSFDFGLVLFDRVAKQLLVADAAAATPRLRLFDLAQSPAVEKGAVDVNPSRGLPPRYIGWY
jgi:hypothetical protein